MDHVRVLRYGYTRERFAEFIKSAKTFVKETFTEEVYIMNIVMLNLNHEYDDISAEKAQK